MAKHTIRSGKRPANPDPAPIGHQADATSAAPETINPESRITDNMNMMSQISHAEKSDINQDALSLAKRSMEIESADARWAAAEAAVSAARLALDRHDGGDEEACKLDDHLADAQRHLCALEPMNAAQAIRQIEVALKDGELSGVDSQAIIDRARRIAGNPVRVTSNVDGWDSTYRTYVIEREKFDSLPKEASNEDEDRQLKIYRDALARFMVAPSPHVRALHAKMHHAFVIEPEISDDYKSLLLSDAARLSMNEMDSDADIRIAHERRLAAIDTIYSRGSYEMSEYHSPKETDVMDTADNLIAKSAAFSSSGALAQAWVAWSYRPRHRDQEGARLDDLIRQANFAELEREELDFDERAMLQLVRTLRGLAGEPLSVTDTVVDTLPQPTKIDKDLADELRGCSEHATQIEDAVRDVVAVLAAIGHGGLLDAAPADSDAYDQHSTAAHLLYMAENSLAKIERIPGTDLSIKLRVLANELRKAA